MDTAALQRRLSLFLCALWGRSLTVACVARESPGIAAGAIQLPAAWTDVRCCRAAAVHAASHIVYGSTPSLSNGLNGRQRALIALLEDARVESLALRDFPGLLRLWLPFHRATRQDGSGFDALLARLARACLDPAYCDDNPWVMKAVALYRAQVHAADDPQAARMLGLQLANDIGQLRIPMNESRAPQVAPYRDDHRHLWTEEQPLAALRGDGGAADAACHFAHLVEAPGGKALPFAAERPEPRAAQGWSIRPVEDDAALEFSTTADRTLSPALRYAEWDYRSGVLRQSWVTVRECDAAAGPAGHAQERLARHAHLLARLERRIGALSQQGRQRLRRQDEGEEIDLDAAVGAAVQLRSLHAPERRVYVRQQLHRREDVTLLLLLDLSASMNDRLAAADASALELLRDASLLLATVLERLGMRFAVAGFHSNGRHEVAYVRCKGFAERCTAGAKSRIAGLSAGLSTRLGAALRHAGAELARQPGERRLLLVITDGQPSDIDVHDARHLTEDARHAAQSLRAAGIRTFCLSLDPRGDAYAARIFGAAHYEVLDLIGRLPEKLPRLVLALTRRP